MANKKDKTIEFFSDDDKVMIEDAIKYAEEKTSGEIRVHVDKKAGKDPLARARDVFEELGMRKTDLHNGVLFYISVSDKKFAILGDDAINEKVPEGFWSNVKEAVIGRFKEGNFGIGIVGGINLAGEKLSEFFPVLSNDSNELSNEMTFKDIDSETPTDAE
jgi:uncharacterized membrane protein